MNAAIQARARPARRARRVGGDPVTWALIGMLAAIATAIILAIAGFLMGEALALIAKGGVARFLTDDGWWPRNDSYNLLPMLAASAALTLGAIALATPLALAFAVYTAFYAPATVRRALHQLVSASAAVPTVIYGLWGVATIVPLLAQATGSASGASLLAGIVVVAIMIFPTLAILIQSALKAVPHSYRLAASALGVSRIATLGGVVLPAAKHGIFSAMVLGAARAIGETMVVLMVCGNIVQLPGSLLAPVRTLTANIALEMPYAMGDHRASLFVSGLLVLLLVTSLVAISGLASRRRDAA